MVNLSNSRWLTATKCTRKGYTARVGKSVASQRLDGVCTAVVVRG